jgi:hypothetical protein
MRLLGPRTKRHKSNESQCDEVAVVRRGQRHVSCVCDPIVRILPVGRGYRIRLSGCGLLFVD